MPVQTYAISACLVALSAIIAFDLLPVIASAGMLAMIALGMVADMYRRRRLAPAATPDARVEKPDALASALSVLAERLSGGDLTARLQTPSGNEELTASAVNSAVEMINTAVDEALALADVSSEGDLTARATGRYPGHAGALTKALNGLLDGLSGLADTLGEAVNNNEQRSTRMADVAASLSKHNHDQVTAFQELEADISRISDGLNHVSRGAASSRKEMASTASAASVGRERIAEAVAAIDRAQSGSKEIDEVTQLIRSVSKQLHLLSVNASVEAAKAGDAGRGFGIVASEIGMLGTKTNTEAQRISEITEGTTAEISKSAALVSEAVDAIAEIEAASQKATEASSEILTITSQESDRLNASLEQIKAKRKGVDANLKLADMANSLADELGENANALHQIAGRFRLSDEVMIKAVRRCAATAGAALEAALRKGEISDTDLFSEQYEVIEGSNPQQFLTPFVPITDRYMPEIIETVFDIGPEVVFGAVMDRNGFLPTHSRKFSKPQGADPVWNAANARNRRFFSDRVGLACGQSPAPHLLQVYRRDMGGGSFVTMKDISAPIIVNGRHWGGFRIGYRSAQQASDSRSLPERSGRSASGDSKAASSALSHKKRLSA